MGGRKAQDSLKIEIIDPNFIVFKEQSIYVPELKDNRPVRPQLTIPDDLSI